MFPGEINMQRRDWLKIASAGFAGAVGPTAGAYGAAFPDQPNLASGTNWINVRAHGAMGDGAAIDAEGGGGEGIAEQPGPHSGQR